MKKRKRNRLKGYDYSQDNLYFVTICVQDRVCCLGEIVDGISRAAREGTARELSVLNPNESNSNQFNLIMVLNEYGSIVQNRIFWLEEQYKYCIIHSFVVMPKRVHAVIEIDSLNVTDKSVKIKSLSELIGAFKTTSSKLIHEYGFVNFKWQRSFHDHIIRNEKAYQNILHYIDKNPEKWNKDSLFESV